ncbi:MAG TPA: ADOP family duplicated permease [Acidobacteriota bacterium]|nr:ADOP family duplicated permease [Acidobacteriota bacterium]
MAEMLRETLRQLRRHPFFALAVALTLSLGIGVNAVMFGIVDRMLMRPPLHVSEPQQVKILYRHQIHQGKAVAGNELTYGNYLAQRDHSSFESIGLQLALQPLSGHGEDTRRLEARLVSASFFPTLGVQPYRGRFFTAEDDQPQSHPVAVLSHAFWMEHFGGDPEVLNRRLEVDSLEFDVVGVAPAGFTGFQLAPVDVWLPFDRAIRGLDLRTDRWLDPGAPWSWAQVVVRLKPGVSIEAAEEESTAILQRADERLSRPPDSTRRRISLQPLVPGRRVDAPAEADVAFWLTAVSFLVLLIACANVANLFLVRGLRRRREIALRLTLGMGRLRLAGHLLSESLLLALLGCAAALGLAYWGGQAVRAGLFPQVDWSTGLLNPRLTAFSLGLALLAALLASLPASFQARRRDLVEPLKSSGGTASPSRSHARSLLLVAQTALSVVLLVGAGLFLHSLQQAGSLDLGYVTEDVVLLTPDLEPGVDRYKSVSLYQEALDFLSRQPGVRSAAAAWTVPFLGGISYRVNYPDGTPLPRLPTGGPWSVGVMGDYFKTMDVEILRGRAFNEEDRSGVPPSLIVSRTMAEIVWPGQDPLGQCLIFQGTDYCSRVVGVAEDVTRRSFSEGPTLLFYINLDQIGEGYPPRTFYVRTEAPPRGPGPEDLRRRLLQMDSRFRHVEAQTFEHLTAPEKRAWRLGATLFSVFGVLALAVSGLGLYSVLAFEAARRRREMSIRSALGATLRHLAALMLSRCLRLALAGIVLGLLLSALLAPNLADLFFMTSPHQASVYGQAALVLLSVSLLACLIPTMRTARTNPATTLKVE